MRLLYAASRVTAKVGDGTQVVVAEETDYPFSEIVRLKVSGARPVRFPLYLRVPRWSAPAVLEVNGERVDVEAEPLTFLRVERVWKEGDTVTLKLPMRVTVRIWKKNKDAASVDYGPLTFSLKIDEHWHRSGGTDTWPEWEVFPGSPWNYGLLLDRQSPERSFEVIRKNGPLAEQPFTATTTPIELRAKARRIPEWKIDRTGLVGLLQQSPARTDEPKVTITLIPMGLPGYGSPPFRQSATVQTPMNGSRRLMTAQTTIDHADHAGPSLAIESVRVPLATLRHREFWGSMRNKHRFLEWWSAETTFPMPAD